MAEEQKPEEASAPKAKSGGIVPWIVVGVLSAGTGSAVPFLLPVDAGQKHVEEVKKNPTFELGKEEDTTFVPFASSGADKDIVVNLNEGRMTRFITVAITMQIPTSAKASFEKRLGEKKAQLRNWLLSELADKEIDDIRGAAGQNRLRREIREHFNAVLFPDGYEQIYDVLFEQFNVQ